MSESMRDVLLAVLTSEKVVIPETKADAQKLGEHIAEMYRVLQDIGDIDAMEILVALIKKCGVPESKQGARELAERTARIYTVVAQATVKTEPDIITLGDKEAAV